MGKSTHALMFCMALAFFLISEPNLAAEVVVFPDPGLDAAVRQAINKPTGDILDTDLVGVGFTALDGWERNISDLAGLEHCTDLTWLVLNVNQITDLTPLAGLINLWMLRLEVNQIADLTPLAGLTNLGMLFLNSNQIADLTPLAGLANLDMLNLSDNKIADLTPLAAAGARHVDWLGLALNQITDLTPLAGRTDLRQVYLDSNQIADLTPLAGLTNLLALGLSSNRIADLTPLASIADPWALYLDSNQITNLAPLVANLGIGSGDAVTLSQNPLDQDALCDQIPRLQSRGANVSYDGTCGPPPSRCTLFDKLEAEGRAVAVVRGLGLGIGENYALWDIEGIEAGAPFGDNIPDLWQLALFSDTYCNQERPRHNEAVAAYEANFSAVILDSNEVPWEIWEWLAASVSLSSSMRATVCALFGLNPQNYVVVTLPDKSANEPFSAEGDCDGDGTSNIEEYEYVVAAGGGMDAYVTVASVNDPSWQGNPATPTAGTAGLLLLCAGVAFAAVRLKFRSER